MGNYCTVVFQGTHPCKLDPHTSFKYRQPDFTGVDACVVLLHMHVQVVSKDRTQHSEKKVSLSLSLSKCIYIQTIYTFIHIHSESWAHLSDALLAKEMQVSMCGFPKLGTLFWSPCLVRVISSRLLSNQQKND